MHYVLRSKQVSIVTGKPVWITSRGSATSESLLISERCLSHADTSSPDGTTDQASA